jgi:RimK family alpha-L-glutamate ligase
VNVAILSGGTGWHVQDLLRAAGQLEISARALDFRILCSACPAPPKYCDPLDDFSAVIVRTMPGGSLEQIVLRMDMLHAAQARGLRVLNPPRAVETCVDKFLTNVRLHHGGLPVPRTIVCQTWQDAMQGFEQLGGDVVLKPIFGSEGRGLIRLTDRELAWRTFQAIQQTGGTLYLQEYLNHPGWDVRAFVLNGHVIAAMKRTANNDWRTNVAQGGSAEPMRLAASECDLAIRAATATGTIVAGVDLIRDTAGNWFVLEVNAVPGWKALSQVCDIDVSVAILRYLMESAQ